LSARTVAGPIMSVQESKQCSKVAWPKTGIVITPPLLQALASAEEARPLAIGAASVIISASQNSHHNNPDLSSSKEWVCDPFQKWNALLALRVSRMLAREQTLNLDSTTPSGALKIEQEEPRIRTSAAERQLREESARAARGITGFATPVETWEVACAVTA